MSDESEWINALSTWGNNAEPRHISEITDIIQLSAISEKIGFYIDSMSRADLCELEIENFEESFSYVNNDFNYVIGFYGDGDYKEFSSIVGYEGTSDYGNHGMPTRSDGETYIQTLGRYIAETETYPDIMVVKQSNHQSRQGDGFVSELHAYMLPSQEAIKAFFASANEAYETLKKMPITIL